MAAPGSPKEGELRAAMSEILQSSELAQLTSRIVRSKLEDKFGVSLADRKKSLDNMMMAMIEEQEQGNNEEDDEDDEDDDNEQISEDDERSKKNRNDSNAEEETEELDDQPSPKKQKMQTDQSVQQSDLDEDVNDEELAWKLQKNERSLRTRRQIKKPRERKVAKSKKNGGEKKVDRKGTGFGKPMILSEKLAAVVGVDRMSRSDVVKKMWEIIKERKLEDPRNKRYTICDEQLASLFGRKKIQTFGMMKHLKKHIKDPDLIV